MVLHINLAAKPPDVPSVTSKSTGVFPVFKSGEFRRENSMKTSLRGHPVVTLINQGALREFANPGRHRLSSYSSLLLEEQSYLLWLLRTRTSSRWLRLWPLWRTQVTQAFAYRSWKLKESKFDGAKFWPRLRQSGNKWRFIINWHAQVP